MRFAVMSEKGKRNNNEDSYLAKKIGDYYVFAVTDGLGGHAAGEIASKIATVETYKKVKRSWVVVDCIANC